MRFEEASELMSLDLDHALPEEERERLERYLSEDSRGAMLLERMCATSLLFERPPMMTPPPSFALRTMQRIQQHERWRTWARRLGVAMLILVIAVALVCVPLAALTAYAVNNPMLSHAAIRLLVQFAEIGRIIATALGITTRALLGGVHVLFLIGWAIAAVLLLLAWVRVVARPRLISIA